MSTEILLAIRIFTSMVEQAEDIGKLIDVLTVGLTNEELAELDAAADAANAQFNALVDKIKAKSEPRESPTFGPGSCIDKPPPPHE